MGYFMDCMTKKYATFSGRARRSEYWFFVLFNIIAQYALQFIVGFCCGIVGIGMDVMSLLVSAIPLIFLFPALAVLVRRMHDIGKSGWYFLLIFIPIIGALILLYFLICDSDPNTNQYGPNPKAGA